MFKKHNYLNIGGYTDANWARDNIDKKNLPSDISLSWEEIE